LDSPDGAGKKTLMLRVCAACSTAFLQNVAFCSTYFPKWTADHFFSKPCRVVYADSLN